MITPGINSLLRWGVAEVIIEPELVKLLESGRPLKLKQGFDPSRPDIHLGHTVGLRKLRQFQEMGHQVILIVGDWTAQIGDPSGGSTTRPMLSPEEVKSNAETYMKQFFKVVDKEKTQVRWQSEWFGQFGLSDVIKLASKFTVAQLLAREDFNRRYTTGRPIAITELLYPLLQAYDSVVIEADVEFGGIDQKFNCLLGRELQVMMGQPPQQVFLVPLLVGTDGSQKMSKSLNNYIGIDEPPNDMYGKVMSIPDPLIMDYFELVTDVPDEELEEFRKQLDAQSVNPMLLKKRLAREIVVQYCSAEAARGAEEHFTKVVQRREMPEEITSILFSIPTKKDVIHFWAPDLNIDAQVAVSPDPVDPSQYHGGTVDVLHTLRLAKSRSEAKRLISQGSIEFNNRKVINDTCTFRDDEETIIKVGKRHFVRLVKTDK
ncbi:MAG TPA: tyrosine--tRNA ligase [Dehalococcoidia bacterium]|nr:tyrosine--tRNA ligase [Dehalococcoidia bacterium]